MFFHDRPHDLTIVREYDRRNCDGRNRRRCRQSSNLGRQSRRIVPNVAGRWAAAARAVSESAGGT